MESIQQILMRRDGITEEEADELVESAKTELMKRIENGELTAASEVCEEFFGLEEDYLDQLI